MEPLPWKAGSAPPARSPDAPHTPREDSQQEALADAESVATHFAQIQKISDRTTLPSLLPHLRDRVFLLIDLGQYTDRLHNAKLHPETLPKAEKVTIWMQLKVASFARSLAAVWALPLLDLHLRVQLNILGRHLYLHTANGGVGTSDPRALPGPTQGISEETQHAFIAYAEWLPRRGVDLLATAARHAAEAGVGAEDLSAPQTHSRLATLLRDMWEEVQGEVVGGGRWGEGLMEDMLLPPVGGEDPALRAVTARPGVDAHVLLAMLEESRRVLRSPHFANAVSMASAVALRQTTAALQAPFDGESNATVPLAKLLPGVSGAGAALLQAPEPCLAEIAALQTVDELCAAVYCSV